MYAPGKRVLRYYCSAGAGAATETKYADVLRSLVRELALKVESHDFKIACVVRDAYNKRQGEVQTKEWEQLFRNLLQENPNTIMVIDALNECETSEATKLLNLIRELNSELPVHIIVSSLEDLDINSYLHRQNVLTIGTSPENLNGDIDYFITCEIATAEDMKQNPLVTKFIFCKYYPGPLFHTGTHLGLLRGNSDLVLLSYPTDNDKELSLRIKKLLLRQARGMQVPL
jgi:hypothetical protein